MITRKEDKIPHPNFPINHQHYRGCRKKSDCGGSRTHDDNLKSSHVKEHEEKILNYHQGERQRLVPPGVEESKPCWSQVASRWLCCLEHSAHRPPRRVECRGEVGHYNNKYTLLLEYTRVDCKFVCIEVVLHERLILFWCISCEWLCMQLFIERIN